MKTFKTIIRPITWLRSSIYVVEHGAANGYVILPLDHPYHDADYDYIPVNVHGGLTYGEIITEDMVGKFSADLTKDDVGHFMVGFDTAHAGDTQETCDLAYVMKETESLRKQLEELYTKDINT